MATRTLHKRESNILLRPRLGILALGSLLVMAGIFLPHGWYDALPKNPEIPTPPVSGLTLLQISFVLEGLALIALSFTRWRFTAMSKAALPSSSGAASSASESLSSRTALMLLAGVTLLALALRLVNLGSDLWLDEIFTVRFYSRLPLLEVLGTYVNFNNHLLNTLLIKLFVGLFGEQEWAIRLPVALFGTATIPAAYWICRQLRLSRAASLGVALILAASYHHIFFSQNARGYIGQVFFALLASGLLVRALQTDRLRYWALYVAVMFLGFASLLTSAYVLIAHALVGGIALLAVMRRGEPFWPLLRRLAAVFSIAGFLAFQLYALVLPWAYMRSQTSYSDDGESGYFSLFSLDLLRELVRGVSVSMGLGESPLALLVLVAGAAVAVTGFVVLLRKNWALTLALSLPGVISAAAIIVMGLTFSPRVFLPVLPFGIVAAIQGVDSLAPLIAKPLGKKLGIGPGGLPRLATVLAVALVVAVSAMSLRYYYSVPKQPYTASLEYVESQRQDGGIVIVTDLAEEGYRYYGQRLGVRENQDYFFVQSLEDFENVMSTHGESRSFVVTTLSRFLHQRKPELEARIAQDWKVVRTFPAAIGDGQISVWAEIQPGSRDWGMGSGDSLAPRP